MISVSEASKDGRNPLPQLPDTVEQKLNRVEDLVERANSILTDIVRNNDGEYIVHCDTYTDEHGVDQFGITKYKRID